MSVLELKGSIIQLLARIDNSVHLSKIEALAHKFVVEEENYDEDYALTPEQEEELRIAVEETYHEENLVSHEEALQVLSRWLPK